MSGAIAALAITVGTTTMGFIKAGKEKRAAEAAELSADIAMAEVEKALTKNEMDALSLQTEAYDREADNIKTATKTEMDAIREGDQRGVLAGSSRVKAGVTEAEAGSRVGMAAELGDLEKLSADEETRKNDIGIQIKLGEAAGAQQAAAALSDSASAGNAAAMQGVASAAMQGANMATKSTYGKSGEAKKAQRKQNKFVRQTRRDSNLSRKDFNAQVLPGLQGDYQNQISGLTLGGTLPNKMVNTQGKDGVVVSEVARTDLSDIKDMTEMEFNAFMMELTPEQRNSVYSQMNQN
ncbi:MAG: hypothetical protein GOVbin3205_15 [Prokaryotic dsDNA virus sp.]|nr:MAG: hypothetical protein GOVbin3205_15 [Prokaryotic dsDNA virus sp.]|tara:strand:+ start:948 stop:1829 length:882 start_codon:yes stop_codon:yes gene_type:complete